MGARTSRWYRSSALGSSAGDERPYCVGVACEDCGNPDVNTRLSNVLVCDRCDDVRIAEYTGFPNLPDPRSPVVLDGPDGRRHRLRFKMEVSVGEGFGTDADIIELPGRGGRPEPTSG